MRSLFLLVFLIFSGCQTTTTVTVKKDFVFRNDRLKITEYCSFFYPNFKTEKLEKFAYKKCLRETHFELIPSSTNCFFFGCTQGKFLWNQ